MKVVIRPRIRPDHDIVWWRKIGYGDSTNKLLNAVDVLSYIRSFLGVGHFYNDLCASMWFTYLMIYLEKVLKFRSSRAGLLMLIGQVTDAIATPLIGIASDSSLLPKFFDKIGRRMSWHIIELSSLDSSRTTMNSLRYSFTVIANLSVFLVLAWFLSENTKHSQIGPSDFVYFRIALLYMLSRLYVNISQVYFPFYITLTQNYAKKYVAIFPMVSYLSSFLVSGFTGIPWFNRVVNRKLLFLIGLVCGVGTCVWMLHDLPLYQMYAVAAFIGVAQAILLITSLSITADLINKNTESGAFVYGAMSFVDKLANGLSYQIIELWNPSCDPTQPHTACTLFYRIIMVYVPGGCLLLALIILLSLLPSQIGHRIRRGRSEFRALRIAILLTTP
ncbi:unnamed protein product [Strongylus vulgaris]|uniref:Major facilitator superfamily associated domain-containing protein n=1 Tax=Strongylus vulgaris TaxID=40348 RepID=A0A3P7JA44_STRVU|nr:unnamed protein product [Strongylus vulgaris]